MNEYPIETYFESDWETINGKKLEIRAYPSKNIHAKVYIGKFKPEDRDYGFVITGSSNFSESGFVANREFNVELRGKRDVLFAEDQFNALWKDSVDISDDFVDTIQNKTWLNDQILPYELYLKLIYEYLEEDINLANEFEPFLPEGFMKLKYQNQAAIQAKKILETYNGYISPQINRAVKNKSYFYNCYGKEEKFYIENQG